MKPERPERAPALPWSAMDDVRVYNVGLPPEEIASIANAACGP